MHLPRHSAFQHQRMYILLKSIPSQVADEARSIPQAPVSPPCSFNLITCVLPISLPQHNPFRHQRMYILLKSIPWQVADEARSIPQAPVSLPTVSAQLHVYSQYLPLNTTHSGIKECTFSSSLYLGRSQMKLAVSHKPQSHRQQF